MKKKTRNMAGIKKGSILCQKCGKVRASRVCKNKKCRYDACFIRLWNKGKRVNLFHDKDGKAYSFTEAFQTLVLINAEMRKGEFKLENWILTAIEERKFKNQYEVWLAKKEKEAKRRQFSFATLRLYRSYFTHHYQALYELDIKAIRKHNIEACLDDMDLDASPKYIKNLSDCLKTFFRWAHEQELIDKLPGFLKIVQDGGQVMHALTYEEQKKHIENLPEEHRDPFWYMREQALRVAETCAVKIKDNDLPHNRVLIQRTYSERKVVETTKQKKKQWIPLTKKAYEVADRNSKSRFGEEFLFINPETGRGYLPDYLRRLWRKYSGCPLTLYEAMRHSTITDWAEKGANAFKVQKGARHSDVRTSAKYVHNAMTDIRSMMDRDNVISFPQQSDAQNIN